MRIKDSQSNTLGLRLVGRETNGSVWRNSGQLNPASTTTLPIQSLQLSALLNYLESEIETLEFKYSGVLDIFLSDTLPRVVRLLSTIDTTITDDVS